MTAGRQGFMRGLEYSWWLVWPLFAVTVLMASVDRACGESSDVLGAWSAQSAVAWSIAAIWIAAHIWFGCVLALASAQAEALEQILASVKEVWPGSLGKIYLMGGLLLLTYLPAALLRLAGDLVSCRP